MSEARKYLNLGCGSRYHPDWINIDIAARGPGVIRHDLSRGIPFPDASCDVVYHAAVLEHLRCADALAFLVECRRVLKPGGIVRVGVPDTETTCRRYLSKLAAASLGDEAAAHDYDWIMVELVDQIVREKRGGLMMDYLRQNPLPNETFVFERIGEEGRQLVTKMRQPAPSVRTSSPALVHRVREGLFSLPGAVRNRILEWLLGTDGMRALEIGRFRRGGEVHQWLYDRFSLARLLEQAGFHGPRLQEPTTSLISGWTGYQLDTTPDGKVIKPDLFFMEAVRPGAVR